MGIYTPSYELFKQAFTLTPINGVTWIIPMMILIITLILITRKPNHWKILALPTILMYRTIGLNFDPLSYPLIGIAGILFVQESLGMEIMGNVITATSQYTTQAIRSFGDTIRTNLSTTERQKARQQKYQNQLLVKGLLAENKGYKPTQKELDQIKSQKVTRKQIIPQTTEIGTILKNINTQQLQGPTYLDTKRPLYKRLQDKLDKQWNQQQREKLYSKKEQSIRTNRLQKILDEEWLLKKKRDKQLKYP